MSASSARLRRAWEPSDILCDASVECIHQENLESWGNIYQWWKALKRLPLTSDQIKQLEGYVLEPPIFSVYRIYEPLVYIYVWPTGEQRWFLATRQGLLIEPDSFSIWDKYMPCVARSQGTFLELVSDCQHLGRISIGSLWFPNHRNYTHFLYDSYAPAAQMNLSNNIIEPLTPTILLFGIPPGWQNEFFSLLPYPLLKVQERMKSGLYSLRLSSITLPIIRNKGAVGHALYNYFQFRLQANRVTSDHIDPSLVFVTRWDARRSRIKNIDQIERLVDTHNGVVLDASSMSLAMKSRFFGHKIRCIAESSGCTNFAIFSPQESSLLELTDPATLTHPEFMTGGWPYHLYHSNRTSFLVGEDYEPLQASPLGSSRYSLEKIEEFICQ
jgi:hypothetical protein